MASPGADPEQEWRRCPDCGALIPAWQQRHRARACPGYSDLWANDLRVKLFAALRAYGDLVPEGIKEAHVRMLTVTAPGVNEGLTWDESICGHRGPHRHDGRAGCRVAPAVAGAWNSRAPGWWTALHNEAAQAAQRRVGARPHLLVRPWELQRRGMLHVHPLVGYSTPREKAAADVYVEELTERAARHGFGFVDRKVEVREPTAAAAYLSSYFVAGKRGKLTLREAVTSADMPRSVVYVAPELSQRSGITMRSLRLKRYLWHQLQTQLDPLLSWGFSLNELYRACQAGVSVRQLIEGYIEAQGP